MGSGTGKGGGPGCQVTAFIPPGVTNTALLPPDHPRTANQWYPTQYDTKLECRRQINATNAILLLGAKLM